MTSVTRTNNAKIVMFSAGLPTFVAAGMAKALTAGPLEAVVQGLGPGSNSRSAQRT